MKNVLIVGGGFAGVYTAKSLLRISRGKPVHVTLISEHNYFLFTPMLHEIATGSISRDNAVTAINQILSNPRFTFIKANAISIDTKKKLVHTDTCSRSYDVLVLATGSSAHYYGTPGALEHTIALRDLSSAYKIRNKIIAQIERADVEENPKKRAQLLTFMIVGAGATGVEVAGELAQFIQTILSSDHRRIDPKDVTILLVHRHKEILNMLPLYYSQKCAAELQKLGVTLLLEREIKKVGEGYVVDQHQRKIEAGTVFWAVGFTPNTLPLDGRKIPVYHVNPSLQVVEENGKVHKNIFALGDCAFVDKGDGQRVPMLAQVAVQQSPVVSRNVLAVLGFGSLKEYRFKLQGFLLSVGDYFAVAGINLFGKTLYFSGFFAWIFWRTMYLLKLIGFGNKVRVAVDWTLNFFYPRDTSEIE